MSIDPQELHRILMEELAPVQQLLDAKNAEIQRLRDALSMAQNQIHRITWTIQDTLNATPDTPDPKEG